MAIMNVEQAATTKISNKANIGSHTKVTASSQRWKIVVIRRDVLSVEMPTRWVVQGDWRLSVKTEIFCLVRGPATSFELRK